MRPALAPLLCPLCRLLTACALLGLVLLPPGVMPHVGASGALEMVLCSAQGPVTMVIDPVTGETHRKPPADSAKPACDWAMAQPIAALQASLPPLAAPVQLDRRATPARANALWRPAHDPRGLYARGPPSVV